MVLFRIVPLEIFPNAEEVEYLYRQILIKVRAGAG